MLYHQFTTNMFSIKDINDMKMMKMKRIEACKCRDASTTCYRCRRLAKRLCRAYHKLTDEEEKSSHKKHVAKIATDEIKARVVYEYVFGILCDEDIEYGSNGWIHSSKREHGHQIRMKILLRHTIM